MNLQTSANLPLEQIVESPLNHRKHFDPAALEELAESVRAHGVLQPVLVRPLGAERYELVYGHRRYRASVLAELGEIPALIRELDDRAVLEIALIENCRRADVRPMEEADAYLELHEKHGVSVKEIAEKVGKSQEYVYARLKICALKSPEVRAALDAGKLSPSTALLIARIPVEKLQAKAAKEILEGGGLDWDDESREEGLAGNLPNLPMSYRSARYHVQDKYMLKLSKAPFDGLDANLVPEAGACHTCPKRTGNCPSLYPEVESADICTDPTCFDAKKKAAVKVVQAKAKEAGKKHLGMKPGLFGGGYGYPSDGLSHKGRESYVELKEKCESDPEQRTYRELLKKEAPIVLALDEKGKEHKLIPKAELAEALAKVGIEFKEPEKPKERDWEAERKEADRKREIHKRVSLEALGAVADCVSVLDPDRFLRLLLPFSSDSALAEHRGLKDFKDIAKLAEKLSGGELQRLFFEGAFIGNALDTWGGVDDELAEICSLFDIDVEAMVKAEEQKGATPEKKASKKKARGAA